MSDQKRIAEILSLLSSYLESASIDDLKRLELFLSKPARKSFSSTDGSVKEANLKWDKLANRLREFDNRDQGIGYLEKAALTRKELESFAKAHDVHIVKADNAERITEKLVEAFIGARLASDAVRGTVKR